MLVCCLVMLFYGSATAATNVDFEHVPDAVKTSAIALNI